VYAWATNTHSIWNLLRGLAPAMRTSFGNWLTRVWCRIRRLQHAFDLNLQAVAVMLDLMQHNERLLSALQRAGLPCDG
jgi:hypothetical protein